MKKYVVLSCNDVKKYYYYLPLVVWAWKQLGWDVIVFYHTKTQTPLDQFDALEVANAMNCKIVLLHDIVEFKSETIAQVSRLYAANEIPHGYLMTSDVDMLPLSDYWHSDVDKFTTWGRDLTDYHYPICYIGAPAYLWREVVKIPYNNFNNWSTHDLMFRDLRKQENMWVLDQDIITKRLLAYGKDKITHIDRGTDKRTGYPVGRIDRSHWTLDHPKYIDAHLPHDILTNEKSFHNVTELLRTVWPKEDFGWFYSYHKEFKKLL